MSEAANELSLIRKYLLGVLKGEEREQLEERVMSDAEFRNTVLSVEENLMEEYAEGALEETERLQFRTMFYSNPQRWVEVQVVEDLKQHAAARWWTRFLQAVRDKISSLFTWKPSGARGADAGGSTHVTAHSAAVPFGGGWIDSLWNFRKAAIAFALLVTVVVGFFIVQLVFRSEQAPSITQEQQRRDQIEQELAQLNNPDRRESGSPSSIVATTLRTGLSRGNESQPTVEFPAVTVARGTASIRLILVLKPSAQEYRSFQAVLNLLGTPESYQVQLRPVELNAGARELVLTLPVHAFNDGDYRVQLIGHTADAKTEALPDHYYYFRLVRQ